MKRRFALVIVSFALAGWTTTAYGQRPVRPAQEPKTPGYNTTYCAGFITDKSLQEGLYVLAGEEGGAKSMFVPGDIVYLSHGTGWIVNPGGEYMVLRRVKDLIRQEAFRGQRVKLEELGTIYKEVGRLKVDIVHARTATARVLRTCEAIEPGDVAIPFNVKEEPLVQVSRSLDPFAPPSGKTTGTIVTGKQFMTTFAQRDIAYLDIGSKQGVAVGQYYRIYRPFDDTRNLFHKYSQEYPTQMMGERLGVRLSPEDQKALPRDVLGELLIIWVEGKSATALITLIKKPVNAGDQVELE